MHYCTHACTGILLHVHGACCVLITLTSNLACTTLFISFLLTSLLLLLAVGCNLTFTCRGLLLQDSMLSLVTCSITGSVNRRH